jgi:ornithine cyclodeaminase/alanine dehydrogenase-like protein (mu-crystallin family)
MLGGPAPVPTTRRPEQPAPGEDRRPLLLGAADVAEVFDLDTALASQRDAFRRLGRGEADQPARLVLPVSEDGSLAFCYAARLAPGSGAVSKFGSVNPSNAAAGLPTVSATVLALNPDDGRLVAILEGTTLTALRTSAASALAATLLAGPGAATAAVLGPGVQGRGHVRALAHALPIAEVRLWGRDRRAAERAAADLDREVRPRVLAAATVAEAVAGADVVAACTASPDPLVEAEQLGPGATVISIGSIAPDRSEVGLGVLAAAGTVVVDHPPAALEHAGPVIQALAAGLLRESDLVGLGEVASGRHPGRRAPDDLVFYNSLGLGVQDAAAAWAIVKRARRLGVGGRVQL